MMENGDTARRGVYAIVNTVTGSVYIGKTEASFAARWKYHRNALQRNRHHNRALQNDWNQYGADAFNFAIVEAIADKSLIAGREAHHIATTRVSLYNIAKCDLSRRIVVRRPMPHGPMSEEYFTANEVAGKLSKTVKEVNDLMNTGALPFVVVGALRRITATALSQFDA